MFHSSKLKIYHENDPEKYAHRELPRPDPIDIDGGQEWVVEAIVDEKGKGRNKRFLIKWEGYPDLENTWEPAANVEETEAMKRVFAGEEGEGCKALASRRDQEERWRGGGPLRS